MSECTLLWFRRDLRLSDHPALTAAIARDRAIIPVFIRDPIVDGLGAAPKFRLELGLEAFDARLRTFGSRLIFRSGDASDVLQALVTETGARSVYWTRAYDPASVTRDTQLKTTLKNKNIDARSFGGHLMFEPWTVATKTGTPFKVYTPFWNAVRDRGVDTPLPMPASLPSPSIWPASEALADWGLSRAMNRGAAVVRDYAQVGEVTAQTRLSKFIEDGIDRYNDARDLPAVDGTSCLSENLSIGEISPHQCWASAMAARQNGSRGAETFLKELVWREFSYHLMHHTPQILHRNWKPDWDAFPWSNDPNHPHVLAWKQGRTGIPFVDAAMRELYVTGRMHNRGRMIVASYLTKHLLTDWRIGLQWFEDCLIDWDPAANAMGWQWAAGSRPDAAPYFRVFNPVTQLEKFDPRKNYPARWLAEGRRAPSHEALKFYEASPRAWQLSPSDAPPNVIVTPEAGRARALSAYENRGF